MKKPYKPMVVSSLHDLAQEEMEPIEPLIDNFLPGIGAYLFCGGLKVGKSLMALDIGLHVSKGQKFWNYDVRKADVLYLDLEDAKLRLQNRMYQMTDDYPGNFYYTLSAMTLDTDLIEQLEEQMARHPDIGLIIIDTLAAVRSDQTAANNSYQADYNNMEILHDFSIKYGITILVVHHVRKMKSEDPFDDISGTNGLYGAADGAFVFRKDKYDDSRMKLYFKNRDMDPRIVTMELDKTTLRWQLAEENTPVEDVFKTDPDLKKAVEYVRQHGEYDGPASKFCELIGSTKKAQSIGGKLFNRRRQLEKMGIYFEKYRRNIGVFFHISVIADVPEDIVMLPPPVIDFPLEEGKTITDIIEEQVETGKYCPINLPPREEKPAAIAPVITAKSVEGEEVKTYSPPREIDFFITFAAPCISSTLLHSA